MNLFVCVKQVPDTESKIKLNASGIDLSDIKWITSPYDMNAIEEAIRWKEKNPGSSLTVVSAGVSRVTDCVRAALAMGCDQGIQIELSESADSFLTAKALAAAIQKSGSYDLIFFGKEAIDDGASQVGALVSEFLKIPAVTSVVQLENSGGQVKAKREIEGGAFESIQLPLPCVVTAHHSLNQPRFTPVPNIMKAKTKKITPMTLQDCGLSESDQKIKVKNFKLPPPKAAGKKLTGDPATAAKELARLLHEEAKVI